MIVGVIPRPLVGAIPRPLVGVIPRPLVGAIRHQQCGRSATGQMQGLAGGRLVKGFGAPLARLAQFHDPQIRRELGGKVQLQGRTIRPGDVKRRIQRAAGIDDQHVPGVEEIHDLAELCVVHPVVGIVRYHQSHLVAGQAAGLGRFARLKLRRKLKLEQVVLPIVIKDGG